MKRLILSSMLLMLFGLVSSVIAREKYYLIFLPNPTPQVISTMAEMGLPLDEARFIKDKGVEIVLEATEVASLRSHNIRFEIIQADLEKYYEEVCLKNLASIPLLSTDDPAHMKYGSMGGFYTFQQVVLDLDSMRLLYPNICTQKVPLGYGWNDNPIYMVKISDNPEIDEDEPECLLDGLHHAREPQGYTNLIYNMWYLLENYGTDPEVTYLVNNRELYFVPIVNPDGLLHNQSTNPNGGGMWRKNRRNNGNGTYGVDLNRNYPYMWGYNNVGSSPTPGSETYRGPSAGSEPETQAMIAFLNAHDIHTATTNHCYGDLYLTAYGYAAVYPEHYDVHMEYASYGAQLNGYSYGPCYFIEYESNGRTQDYQLHQHDIINIEPEIGGSFWPSITYIMPNAQENQRLYLHLEWCAGGLVEGVSVEAQDGFLNPGAIEGIIVTLMNKGWGTSEAVNYTLTTADPYVTLLTATGVTDTLVRRTQVSNSANPFTAIIDSTCPNGHQVNFVLSVNQGGYARADTFMLMTGEPTIFFQDNAETGLGNWTSSGGWGLSNINPHAGSFSFTESPTGNYGNNVTAYLTMVNPINLAATTSLWLEFWTRWDIETNYDFAQVEVSTNGTTWTPIAGQYTVPGSGIGVQPAGQPGYEGSHTAWTLENMILNQYAGATYFKIRWEFRSDGGVVGDGWNVDDIKLLGFTEPITPPNLSLTLTPINPPIVIPATGGSFQFTVTIVNNETTPETFDAWTNVQLPNGNIIGPIILRPNITLAPGGNLFRSITQAVPATAPSGTYEYRAFLGLYPGTVYNQQSFNFSKQP